MLQVKLQIYLHELRKTTKKLGHGLLLLLLLLFILFFLKLLDWKSSILIILDKFI